MKRNIIRKETLSNILKNKGIVIFGSPGSGKTSVAHQLVGAISDVTLIEISSDIIRPLMSKVEMYPSLADFLPDIIEYNKEKHNKVLDKDISDFRMQARNLFIKFSLQYGSTWVADIIDIMRVVVYSDRLLIVSGVRGFNNAYKFSYSGYFTVFLKVSQEVGIARQSKRDGVSRLAILKEQEEENKIFNTHKIESIADLVIDVTHLSLSDIKLDIIKKINQLNEELRN